MPLAPSNRLKSPGFRPRFCTDLQPLRGVWECHKCCPEIIPPLQKDKRGEKKKEAWWDEGSQKAEAEQGGNTKLWLLDGLQQRKAPLFFKIQNSISLLQKHIVAAPARKMKRCCFSSEMNSHASSQPPLLRSQIPR